MGDSRHLVCLFLCACLSALGSSQTVHQMAVKSDIRFRFATTEITCVMTNDLDSASELTFDFTLPKDAFIANFSMKIDGKDYPGDVKKKQEARQEYLAARQSGSSGGLVEQSARHSNKFDVSVNMAAGSSVTFTLIYQELLRRRFGSYEYSVYVDSKMLSKIQDYSVEIYIQDRNPIRDVRTPAMRKEVMSNAVEEDQNLLTQITSPSESTVYVVYKPTPEQLKKQGAGWFVVQYDVESNSAGELMVVDGYFLHFFVPPEDLPPLPLDIVFVLDISGSMAGRKMTQLKDAMDTILGDLRETDRFNILLFDGSVQQWEGTLQEASQSNVDRAQGYVREINYRGSTNLHLALLRGLQVLQGSRESSRVPMIFFLTDGEATAGEQDPAKIMADISRKNEGVVNVYSLAFGAGADYKLLRQISAQNNGFARKIYEASDAADQVLGLYQEISTIVMRGLSVTYHSTSNNDDGDDDDIVPVVVDNSTVTICDLSLLFGSSDFVVAGRLENAELLKEMPEKAGGLKLEVSGLGAGKQQINFVLEENDLSSLTLSGDNPFWAVPRDLSKLTERAWAFLLIKQLLKEKVAAAEDKHLVKELDQKILDLSLKYHFVTPLTSMVVTRPEDGLKKNQSKEASFTSDEDVPAAKRSNVQAAHMFPHRRHHMAHSQVQGVNSPHFAYSLPVMSPKRGGAAGVPSPDLDDMADMMGLHPPMPPTFAPATHMPLAPATHVSLAPATHMPLAPATHMSLATATHMPLAPATHVSLAPATQRPSRGGGGIVRNRPHHSNSGSGKRKDKRLKRKRGRVNKKGRRRNKAKGNKQCVRNKRVFLHSVMVSSQSQPLYCFELRAPRTPLHNYTLISNQNGNFSVTVALKRKFLSAIYVHRPQYEIMVTVNAKGEITSDNINAGANASPDDLNVVNDGKSLRVEYAGVNVTVGVQRMTCKVTILNIDVVSNLDPFAAAQKFSGIVAKGFGAKAGKSKRRGKARRKRVPKGCQARNVPDMGAAIVKGNVLKRFKA